MRIGSITLPPPAVPEADAWDFYIPPPDEGPEPTQAQLASYLYGLDGPDDPVGLLFMMVGGAIIGGVAWPVVFGAQLFPIKAIRDHAVNPRLWTKGRPGAG